MMIRKLKTLSLACGVVLAVSGMSAAAASAVPSDFEVSSSSANVRGVQIGTHVFGSTAGNVTCGSVKASATQTSATASQLTLTPVYEECHINIFGSKVQAKVNMTGCHYLWTPGLNTGPQTYTGEEHITCPAGVSGIMVEAAGCSITTVPQTIDLDLENRLNAATGKEDIHVTTTGLQEIDYTHSGFTCGTGSGTNGTYTGQWTLTATDTAGNPTNLTIVPTL